MQVLSIALGMTLVVDVSCWLHKGSYGCAMELGLGQKADSYVTYCLKYLNLLLSHDIKPVIVFDGIDLPAKREITLTRRRFVASASELW